MSGETLKFHWSNPKFDGLPWPADKKLKAKTKRSNRCVKVPYEKEKAQEELWAVQKEHGRTFRWVIEPCAQCDAWHLVRLRWTR